MTWTLLLAGLFLGLVLFEGPDNFPEDFQIRFGIIEPDEAGLYDVAVETTNIPLICQQKGFLWGYSVLPPHENHYTTSEILELPSPPRHIDFPMPIEKKEGGRIIITPSVIRRNHMVHFYGFSEGDPSGDWKLQIFINNRPARTIRFTVTQSRGSS